MCSSWLAEAYQQVPARLSISFSWSRLTASSSPSNISSASEFWFTIAWLLNAFLDFTTSSSVPICKQNSSLVTVNVFAPSGHLIEHFLFYMLCLLFLYKYRAFQNTSLSCLSGFLWEKLKEVYPLLYRWRSKREQAFGPPWPYNPSSYFLYNALSLILPTALSNCWDQVSLTCQGWPWLVILLSSSE